MFRMLLQHADLLKYIYPHDILFSPQNLAVIGLMVQH
jgi:hypothetical protein